METLSRWLAVFFLKKFLSGHREGAGKVFKFLRKVDVDDKNCLAELTVVLKLNQSVRQWPYIIADVLFFRSFFRASKRKNIDYLFFHSLSVEFHSSNL